MAYKVIILYRLYMPSYFLGTFTEYPYIYFAEGGGFEPPIRFWRIHAFQACLFNHSSISPFRGHIYILVLKSGANYKEIWE